MNKKGTAKKFYVTTPIYYINARPHLGTCYTTVIADILARFHRMKGEDVLFVTGSDENSQKTLESARSAGLSPQEFCAKMVEEFKSTWKRLYISDYVFVRTTDPAHVSLVQHFFARIYEKGDIYKGKYSGYYCMPCETFYKQSELAEGEFCPKCSRKCQFVEEDAYFFKLSAYEDRLRKYFEENPRFVVPDFRRNEMLARLNEGLQDICISRSTLDWGIPLPWDNQHVFYVWVDALLAYLTGSGYRFDTLSEHYWPAQLNLMAKDIPWFHAIVFPAMLFAYGLPPVEQMMVHGYWLIGGEKMSKSKGVAISPEEVMDKIGVDGLRYFYAREVPLGQDGTISIEAVVNRYNFDLGNDLGNLLNRVLPLAIRYMEHRVPPMRSEPDVEDTRLLKLAEKVREKALELYEAMELSRALEEIFTLIRECNKFIDTKKPWEIKDKPERVEEISTSIKIVLDILRDIAILLCPVIPQSSQKMYEQLGLDGDVFAEGFETLGMGIPPGTQLGEPVPLFPRVEL